MDSEQLHYLEQLSELYPTISRASAEIINLQSILNLPKGTEHFISDIHGVYDAFSHVLKNGSGAVRKKIDDVFGHTLSNNDKRSLATLIYYPKEKIEYVKKQEEDNRTVGIFQKRMELEPVVGWLVCVDGADKGKDYKLYGKNNTIGRSERMDVYIKNDPTISRENHARLAYDPKHNNFQIIPADSTNNIYLNDEPIYVPTKLNAYDVVEFGETKMVFVPFCNDQFQWKTGR